MRHFLKMIPDRSLLLPHHTRSLLALPSLHSLFHLSLLLLPVVIQFHLISISSTDNDSRNLSNTDSNCDVMHPGSGFGESQPQLSIPDADEIAAGLDATNHSLRRRDRHSFCGHAAPLRPQIYNPVLETLLMGVIKTWLFFRR